MPRQRLLLVNKPFHMLTQFTSEDGKASLQDVVKAPDMYPAGRLDYDSEGLVLLTNWGALQARLAEPRFKVAKTYFVQVEGVPDESAIERLRNGIELNDGVTCPAQASLVDEPNKLVATQRKRSPESVATLTLLTSNVAFCAPVYGPLPAKSVQMLVPVCWICHW